MPDVSVQQGEHQLTALSLGRNYCNSRPIDTESLSRNDGFNDVAELAILHTGLASADGFVETLASGLDEKLVLLRDLVADGVCVRRRVSSALRRGSNGESEQVALRSPWKLRW